MFVSMQYEKFKNHQQSAKNKKGVRLHHYDVISERDGYFACRLQTWVGKRLITQKYAFWGRRVSKAAALRLAVRQAKHIIKRHNQLRAVLAQRTGLAAFFYKHTGKAALQRITVFSRVHRNGDVAYGMKFLCGAGVAYKECYKGRRTTKQISLPLNDRIAFDYAFDYIFSFACSYLRVSEDDISVVVLKSIIKSDLYLKYQAL